MISLFVCDDHNIMIMILILMMIEANPMIIAQVMGRRQGGAGRGRLRAARSEDFLNRWLYVLVA